MPSFINTTRLYILTGVLAVFLLAAIFFRDDVSRFLSFDNKDSDIVFLPPAPDNVDNVDGGNAVIVPAPVSLPPEAPPSIKNPPVAPAPPVYTGKNPREISPVPEEVKLFTEDQRKTLYNEIDNYGEAVMGNPYFFKGWIQLGLIKKVIGDFEGARDAWYYAGLIAPENVVSFANLGELYWRYLPDFPKSEKNFRQAIKNDPKRPEIYISLAELYYYSYKEKADLADNAYLEGLVANPNDDMLMRHLATYYKKIGDTKNALSWWKKILGTNPSDASEIAAIIASLEK